MKKVEVTIDIGASPAQIINAFMDLNMLQNWWKVERALIEKQEGGIYTLVWNITDKGMRYVSTGVIKNYDPTSTLEIGNFVYLNPDLSILGPMKLTIIVRKKDQFSELYICQSGYQDGADWNWYYEAVKQSWPIAAETLKEFLEKKDRA